MVIINLCLHKKGIFQKLLVTNCSKSNKYWTEIFRVWLNKLMWKPFMPVYQSNVCTQISTCIYWISWHSLCQVQRKQGVLSGFYIDGSANGISKPVWIFCETWNFCLRPEIFEWCCLFSIVNKLNRLHWFLAALWIQKENNDET